ncbi:MAG TPA: acyltransferase [Bacteroidetes bacterium]|nr:acyltransferase [Bacteroidota bacterium]
MKRFYWRRTLRIFPLYFSFLLIVTLVFILMKQPVGIEVLFPYLYSYTLNFGIGIVDMPGNLLLNYLWSLSFEEQFYLLWPVLIFLLPRRGILYLCIGILLLSPLTRYFLAEYWIAESGSRNQIGGMIYYLPFGQLDTFATGALLAVWRGGARIKKPLLIFGLAFGAFVLAGFLNAISVGSSVPNYCFSSFGYPIASLYNGQHVWGYSLINLVAATGVLVAIHPAKSAGGWLRKFLEMPWLVWIGRISYGLYIIHWPVQYALEKLFHIPYDVPLRLLLFLPYLALVLGLSWLSFRYFESWFMKKKSSKWNSPPDSAIEE